ncbi:SIMPL domain-containing protein [Compostimonas suwonensis]|uniref:Uncharacterized protein n=1 Tax=Compostimonas suwonensis TaxID=1048394 RepID=A0A2M9C545_9MICO|nr:SIMPL domain-containing protein [Compostimonas suwonensis]PJJ65636.1 hypothetical protein CLV54_0673 [Compostimonas suwonensis]
MSAVTISVTGTAERRAPAERGTVSVAIAVEVPDDGSKATEAAVLLSEELAEQARGFVSSGEATWWSSEQLSTRTFDKYENSDEPAKETRITRYHGAYAGVQVRFQDFAALGRWVTRIADIDDVSLAGVSWAITDATTTELAGRVRAEAVADARARAEAYAAASGLGEVALVQLWEAGLRPDSSSPGEMLMARAAFSSTQPGGFPFKPEDVVVSATITADYRAQ